MSHIYWYKQITGGKFLRAVLVRTVNIKVYVSASTLGDNCVCPTPPLAGFAPIGNSGVKLIRSRHRKCWVKVHIWLYLHRQY